VEADAMTRRSGAVLIAALLAVGATHGEARAAAGTLQEALALTYATNPALLAARAQLRSVDENVPQALAGWRPQVQLSGSAGMVNGIEIQHTPGTIFNAPYNTRIGESRPTNTETLVVAQPVYRGGQTRASVNHSENQVMGQRASLIASEETAFINTVNAYVGVIQATQTLALAINNEQVLQRQLDATNDQFRVGEVTRTDVAQAEAALAGAVANRETAEGNLQIAQATYQQVTGEWPGKLLEPQPLRLAAKNVDAAGHLAAANNPNVVAALFSEAAAKDNIDLQWSKLMPNLSLQGTMSHAEDSAQRNLTTDYAQIMAVLTIPIYQGGSEYAAIRQARQQQQQARRLVDDARRTAVQQAVSAWQTYAAAKATAASTRSEIRSNQIALEGVEREHFVGSRTTLDVLNAEQALLASQVQLVQNLAALVNASYQVAQAVGRLTARDLNLNVPIYDEIAYYKAVRNSWFGTGDAATGQPSR
jgi:outer membrane protein